MYIREAHPDDGWQVPANKRQGIVFNRATTLDERVSAATTCARDLKIDIPILIDGMDDKVEAAYQGWPDRIYIVGKDGIIAYQGGKGPAGFDPAAARKALALRTN